MSDLPPAADDLSSEAAPEDGETPAVDAVPEGLLSGAYDDAPRNPFDPRHPHPPFAGRDAALSRLHYHLTDLPLTAPPPLFLGRRRIGKSALLRRFDAAFEDHFIGVYIPLRRVPLDDEAAWLQVLVEAIRYTLEQRRFVLSLTTEPPADLPHLREWLRRVFLPLVFHVIRAHRRVILLLDDAERLVQAMDSGALPNDHPRFLATLLHAQLGMALTMDTAYEDHLGRLVPLVDVAGVHRLSRLSDEACLDVLAQCRLGEGAARIVQAAVGGEPILLQRLGYHLYALSQTKAESLSAHDVNTLLPLVYADSEGEFAETWSGLLRDERLVLTAMSTLLYEDTAQPVSIGMIERWLVDTDYPLDMTTISAAVRGLEYRELVTGGIQDLRVGSGLMQRWLVNNARLTAPQDPAAPAARRGQRGRVIAAALVVLLLLALVYAISSSEAAGREAPPVPTVTLPSGS